jgi:hypothetical protein
MTYVLEPAEIPLTRTSFTTRLAGWPRVVIGLAIIALFVPTPARAQGDGARFYWKGLTGATVVPIVFNMKSGNTNPFDPAHTVLGDSNFDASLMMAGFGRALAVSDRAASVSVLFPMGSLSGQAVVDGKAATLSAGGFGDPMLQAGLNILGPKAIKNIPDVLRYEPGFSIDVIGSLAVPIGEYNSEQPLNIGQNRWYGRVGAPIVWQLGSWAPEQRTTLEFLPALWIFGPNNDFVGKTMKTDPLFQLEGHLTHNFAKGFWASLDAAWYSGGKATIDGVAGEKLNNVGLFFTAGYELNANTQLTVGYGSTIGDNDPSDLRMNQFRVTLVYFWHPLIEGMKRLGGN